MAESTEATARSRRYDNLLYRRWIRIRVLGAEGAARERGLRAFQLLARRNLAWSYGLIRHLIGNGRRSLAHDVMVESWHSVMVIFPVEPLDFRLWFKVVARRKARLAARERLESLRAP